MIYIGADHRGFNLKEKVKEWLTGWRFEFEDVGALILNPEDDYTVFAEAVAKKIQENPLSPGVLICGSGVGVDVTANKFDGVRASIGKLASQVKAGRHDDNMNVLVLAADFTKEKEAKEMLNIFLGTKYAKEERFERRLNDIKKIEKTN